MRITKEPDPHRYFRTVLGLAILSAVVALALALTALLHRFYVQETVELTEAGVLSHFRTVFQTQIFHDDVANPEAFDRMVRLHFGLYDIVDTRIYRADGRQAYGYGPLPPDARPPAEEQSLVQRGLGGDGGYTWIGRFDAPDGQTYGPVLRVLIPIWEESASPTAGAGGTAGGDHSGHGGHDGHMAYDGGDAGTAAAAGAGAPVGVVVVYRDAAKGMALVRTVQAVVTLVLLGVGLVLYLALGRVYRHATRRIEHQSEMLRQALGQLEQSYSSTLQTLSRALDARDHETEGHSLRVAWCSLHLARRMGVTGTALDEIFRGALLHDVGKIAVPDAILRKPGPLTPAEWVAMRGHAAAGHEILRDLPFVQGALPIVLHHHERWDGNGYPDGLRGEEIPLGARIFAVIDTLDAVTSDRPYRPARSIAEAQAEIRAGSGTQFDPRVVEAFLQVPAREWEQIRQAVAGAPGAPRSAPLPVWEWSLAGD